VLVEGGSAMKVGDLVTISAKGRRLRDRYGKDGSYLYPEDEYTVGIVVSAPKNSPKYAVTVQWSNGEKRWMIREVLKHAKHPKRPSSKRKAKDGNL